MTEQKEKDFQDYS